MNVLAALLCDVFETEADGASTLRHLFDAIVVAELPGQISVGYFFEFGLDADEIGKRVGLCEFGVQHPDGAFTATNGVAAVTFPGIKVPGRPPFWTVSGNALVTIEHAGPHLFQVRVEGVVVGEREINIRLAESV